MAGVAPVPYALQVAISCVAIVWIVIRVVIAVIIGKGSQEESALETTSRESAAVEIPTSSVLEMIEAPAGARRGYDMGASSSEAWVKTASQSMVE
jgi:hypothetical protein